jgi:hypothetical protein
MPKKTPHNHFTDDDDNTDADIHLPQKPDPRRNLFLTLPAYQWLVNSKNMSPPKMLFGQLWYDGELCILFADTNAGKSVLAVQIGNSLADGVPIGNFKIETPPVNVVYIDFELTGTQFKQRYTHAVTGKDFDFCPGFYRAEFNPVTELPPGYTSYDEYMNAAIEYAITHNSAKVLIIDNITCLRNGSQNAADALLLMKHLKALKAKLKISILVLAHTPKRNPAKPITRNDLQGSKMLINFADSAFAIGESHAAPGLRYLKQIKQRATTLVYGADNVCVCRITKPANSLLFEFEGTARERDHLLTPTQQDRQLLAAQITQLNAQGMSQRQISAKLNVGLGTVNRVVNKGEGVM